MTCSHCGGEWRTHPCGWCEGTGQEPGLTRLQQAFTELSEQVTPAPVTPPAAAVPVSPAMVAATCAAHGSFDPRCETCPHCLQEQSIRRLSAVPVSQQEPEQARFVEKICPFCGENDFDAWGLKFHLSQGGCYVYNETTRETREASHG